MMDTSMFVFFADFFGAHHPEGNAATINGWEYTQMETRKPYFPRDGVMGDPALSGKKSWMICKGGTYAPFYLPTGPPQNGTTNARIRVEVVDNEEHFASVLEASSPMKDPVAARALVPPESLM